MPPRLAGFLAALLIVTGCSSETPDYQSIWSSSSTASPTPTQPAEKRVPIAEYLSSVGVQGEPVPLNKLTDLTVTLPRPPGWGKYNNPNFAPMTEAIAKNNNYPTAMLLVFRLYGNFDVAEAIKHGYADAELSQNFTQLNASMDNFRGFPSSMIEGSYNLTEQRLHSYNRVVIATTPAPAFVRYLVQLTVTSRADEAVTESSGVEAIISGFSVAVR